MNWNADIVKIDHEALNKACLECVLNSKESMSAVMVANAIGVPVEFAETTLFKLYARKELYRYEAHAMAGGKWWVYCEYTEAQKAIDADQNCIRDARHYVITICKDNARVIDKQVSADLLRLESMKQYEWAKDQLNVVKEFAVTDIYDYAKHSLERQGYSIERR